METASTVKTDHTVAAKGVEKTAILLADISAPATMTPVPAQETPPSVLKAFMTGLLTAIGQHNGRSLSRTDTSLVACFESPTEAIKCAVNMQQVSDGVKKETGYPLAVRVVIDYGWNDGQKKSLTTQAEVLASVARILRHDSVLVSKAVRTDSYLENVDFQTVPQKETEGRQMPRFLKVLWRNDADYSPAAEVKRVRFAYGMELCCGKGRPCFYCGSRNHRASACPSKLISEMTRGLRQLGRLTLFEINDAFRRYLSRRSSAEIFPSENPPDPALRDPVATAHFAFYDLKCVFQLRFLNAIWDPPEHWANSWDRIRSGDSMALSGGKLRLAADYLRAGQLDQAERILEALEWNNPRDFRFYSLAGFVSVERDALRTATHFFAKACECARTNPQKIYTLLLKYRALLLDGKNQQAEETLRLCLSLDRYCPEPAFEGVLMQFDSEKTEKAFARLLDLIRQTPEYWAAAIICPDLALHHDLVAPGLEKVLQETRSEGRSLLESARRTIDNLKQAISEEDREILDIEADHRVLHDLSLKDTYLDWCDVVTRVSKLISICERTEQDRRNKVLDRISSLQDKLLSVAHTAYTGNQGIQQSILEIKHGLSQARAGLQTLVPHRDILSRCAQLSEDIERIEARLLKLQRRDMALRQIRAFSRDLLIFLGIAGAIAVGLAPLILGYLQSSSYAPDLLRERGVAWIYNTIAAVGIVSSICFALIRRILKPLRKSR